MSKLDYSFISKYLIKKTKQGYTIEEIVYSYMREFEKELQASDEIKVTTLFEEATKDYPNYELAKTVLEGLVINNIETNETHLFNIVTKKMVKIDQSVLKKLFDGKYYNAIMDKRMHSCVIGYNPYERDIFYTKDGIKYINMYRPADWQFPYFYGSKQIPKDIKMPKIYEDFFNHITGGNELSYKYLLHFIANTVQPVEKPLTYLTILGKQGLGKGLLGSILELLVGENNYTAANFAKMEDSSRFNGTFKNKKIINIDEVNVRNKNHEDMLKNLVNDKMEIEEKGKDKTNLRNYASIYITANRLDSLRVENGDRRYCFLDTGNETLIEYCNRALNTSQHDLINELTNLDNISKLGQYLLTVEVDKVLMSTVLNSKTKRNQRSNSLQDWEQLVFSVMARENAGKEITLEEARNKIREIADNSKINPGRETWKHLSEKMPGFFSRVKKTEDNGKQRFYLKFEKLDKQPKEAIYED